MVEQEFFVKISMPCYPDELLFPTLLSYADRSFHPSTRLTAGATLPSKQIKLENNLIRLFLADFSTKRHFAPLRLNYIRGSSAAVFAYSKNNRKFLDSAIALYRWFKRHTPHPVPIVAFLGLHADPELVSQKDGEALAQELNVDFYEMAVDDLQALDTILMLLLRKVIVLKTS